MQSLRTALLALTIAVALVACGGGESDDPRQAFIDGLAGSGFEEDVAGCIYDGLVGETDAEALADFANQEGDLQSDTEFLETYREVTIECTG